MPQVGQGDQALSESGTPPLRAIFYPGPPPRRGRKLASAQVESTLKQKPALIETIIHALKPLGLGDEAAVRVRLCLDEAITNAINHGNRHDPTRKVHAEVRAAEDSWSVTISDEGEGFDPGHVPDPEQKDALLRESGRGVLLMLEFMDEVRFYSSGRCVWLSRRYESAHEREGAVAPLAIDRSHPGIVLLVPAREAPLDEVLAQRIEAIMADLLRETAGQRVALDMSKITYVTDSGIGLLVVLQGRILQRGGSLTLVAPTELVRQILAATNLDSIFRLVGTVGEV